MFAGTPMAAVPSLQALIASPRHDVLAVVTRPDAPAGRGRTLTSSPIKELARANDIDVLTPQRPSDPAFIDELTRLDPDCCPVVAYGALIPPAVLVIPTIGWVNLHFSLLPAWRGAAPVQRSIIAGDDITGASTFLLEAGLDTGPVFGVVTTEIGARETSGELLARLAVAGADLLVATLDGIEDGTLSAVPQPVAGVSIAPKLEASDAHINWQASGIVIDRLVRGCTPEPGAWTTFREQRFGISEVLPTYDPMPLAPGALRLDGRAVLVGTGTTPVALVTVKPAGRAAMNAGDWARGARLAQADGFA